MATTKITITVLDAGALIALERSDPRMIALLVDARAGRVRLILPDAVLARVWRGGSGRQARLASLVGLPEQRCERVPLDTAAARRIGVAIRDSGHTDVVDVHVAHLAGDRGATVVTSDREDLLAVDGRLAAQILDI